MFSFARTLMPREGQGFPCLSGGTLWIRDATPAHPTESPEKGEKQEIVVGKKEIRAGKDILPNPPLSRYLAGPWAI